ARSLARMSLAARPARPRRPPKPWRRRWPTRTPSREIDRTRSAAHSDHGVTVKDTPLLGKPPALTTIDPVVAPAGTRATMLFVAQDVAVAPTLPNITVFVPCDAPKLRPAIVMDDPTLPVAGDRDAMYGVGCPDGLVGAVPALRYWLWQPPAAIAN